MSGEQSDSIDFMARYKDWISVKKMSIKDGTNPEEIAFHLAAIRQAIDRKAFDILGLDTKSLDDLAARLASGKRKNYANLAEALQELGKPEAKSVVENSCSSKAELIGVASTYLFRRVVQDLGFDFDVNQEMLSKAYPNLKLPKPPGRFKKQ